MTDKKKILILTADAGFGHRSAANAVTAALNETHGRECKVEVVNPLDDRRAPFFLRDSQADYDNLVRDVPELYRMGYDASDSGVAPALMESALTVLLYEVMHDVIQKAAPDAIVNTYPMYQAPLDALFKVQRRFIPLFTVITDLANVHRTWFNDVVTGCLVATDRVRAQALASGIPPGNVHITGIPVNPKIASETRSKAELRSVLGWHKELTTILAVGSRSAERLLDTLAVVNHYGAPLQLVVVAGSDAGLHRTLHEQEWHIPVHIYEYVTNMPEFMLASDAVLCKAGGLILSEALACGLPVLLMEMIAGQESGNAEYIVQSGAGDLVFNQMQLLEVLSHWLSGDAALLRRRHETALSLGKPRAAYDVAAHVWQGALVGPDVHRRRISGRPRLVDLLKRSRVQWREARQTSRNRRQKSGG